MPPSKELGGGICTLLEGRFTRYSVDRPSALLTDGRALGSAD